MIVEFYLVYVYKIICSISMCAKRSTALDEQVCVQFPQRKPLALTHLALHLLLSQQQLQLLLSRARTLFVKSALPAARLHVSVCLQNASSQRQRVA
jgi:hypothetical protein